MGDQIILYWDDRDDPIDNIILSTKKVRRKKRISIEKLYTPKRNKLTYEQKMMNIDKNNSKQWFCDICKKEVYARYKNDHIVKKVHINKLLLCDFDSI